MSNFVCCEVKTDVLWVSSKIPTIQQKAVCVKITSWNSGRLWVGDDDDDDDDDVDDDDDDDNDDGDDDDNDDNDDCCQFCEIMTDCEFSVRHHFLVKNFALVWSYYLPVVRLDLDLLWALLVTFHL